MSEQILQKILAEVQGIKDEVQGIKDEMQGVKDEMQGVKGEMQGFKDEVQGIKDEVQGIKDEVQGVKDEVQGVKDGMQGFKDEQLTTNARLERIEKAVSDIPLIKQAVLETNGIVKNLESSVASFERQTNNELNHHDFTIDILNRRQLKLEAEVEKLKNR